MGIIIALLPLAVGLVIAYFAANEFYQIAVMKGHPERKYFWWCFLMGMIGWPMVIALPDRRGTKNSSGDDLPEL